MKKLLFLLIAAATVLAFSMPATAAEYVGHQECCDNCDKCQLDSILCPTVASTNQSETCLTQVFDYDGKPAIPAPAVAIGYLGVNAGCKVIFDICCCDADAIAYFTEDQTIGVRMTALGEGFYFTDDTIFVDMYAPDETSLCVNTWMNDPRPFTGAYNYRDGAGDEVEPAPDENVPCEEWDESEADGYRAVVVESPRGEGVQISADMIADNLCKWWFDMPAMAYDPLLAVPGSRVNVKIELLTAVDGLCGEWKTICECIVDLGVFCPEPDFEVCFMFPYVLTQSNGWATGITLSNVGSELYHYSTMAATLEITDKLGNTYTYEKTFSSDEYVWSFSLDTLLSSFSGTPEAGPAVLKIRVNYPMAGYAFLTNGNYAGGTYALPCLELLYTLPTELSD